MSAASENACAAFLAAYDDEESKALTGLTKATFTVVYVKYCGTGTPIFKPVYLWWTFKFLKLYPINRAMGDIHHGRYKSRRCFQTRVYHWIVSDQTTRYLLFVLLVSDDEFLCSSMLSMFVDVQRFLADNIDELGEAWVHRNDAENAIPHVFARSVTGAVDSFPIMINRPKTGNLQRIFYNGKYGCHVVKVRR